MKNIMMKIIGTQVTADLEEDQLEFITEGKLYEKGDALYLIYDESEISGMPGCRTRLKLKNGTIDVYKRQEHAQLPDFNLEHKIIFIEKTGYTPSKYPRKAGTPSKDPLK